MGKPIKHYGGWRIRWKDENGTRQSEVHTAFKDAEFALRRHQTQVAEIRRKLRPADLISPTFDQLCDYYLTHYSSQKRRRRDDEGIIRNHLRGHFAGKSLRDIKWAEDLNTFRLARKHLSQKTLHNQLTLLISMLIVAKDHGWIQQVPKIKKPRLRLFDKDFNYLRTKEEIARFLASAMSEGQHVHALYATAVFSGMREGELAGLQWDDVDFGKRLITVQRSYNGPTKSGEIRFVPILDPLLPVLREWRLKCPTKLVFTTETGNMLNDSSRVFQEVFHRVLDAAGFPKIERNGKERRYIVFHDLRHSFASHWVMNSGDLFRLQKVLGHKTVQMTMRYAHLAPHVFAEDYSRLGAAGFGGPGTVIAIPGR